MDRVICIKKKWITVHTVTAPPNRLPEYEKIYTIDQLEYFNKWDVWGITLKELESNQFFELDAFKPIDASFAEWIEQTILKDAELEDTLTQNEQL